MESISAFIVECSFDLWNYMTSQWLPASIMFVYIILPKLLSLFKHTIGH